MTPEETREAVHWILLLTVFIAALTVGGFATDRKTRKKRPMAEYID